MLAAATPCREYLDAPEACPGALDRRSWIPGSNTRVDQSHTCCRPQDPPRNETVFQLLTTCGALLFTAT
jgi:hypothetical protein